MADVTFPIRCQRYADFAVSLYYGTAWRPDPRAYPPGPDNAVSAFYTDAAMTVGSPVLTSATAGFNAGDVNRWVLLRGAGANFGDLASRIVSVQSAIQVTLADNAGSTVVNGWFGVYVPVDLTGATGKAEVRPDPSANPVLTFQTSDETMVLNAASGRIDLSQSADIISAVKPAQYQYDTRLLLSGSRSVVPFGGPFTIDEGVTQP